MTGKGIDRSHFLIGSAAFGLTACSGLPSKMLSGGQNAELYRQMRAVGLISFREKDKYVVLPEYASRYPTPPPRIVRPQDCPPQTLARGLRRPLEDCTGAAANPASVNTDDGYPTIVNEMANNYPEYLTQYTGNWYFQLMYANPYPYSVGPYYGPTYHTSSFNWNCALAAIGSATTAASTIAQRIVSNPSAYGAAATNVAKLFLAGLTSGGAAWTAAEFFTAIAAILTAADLIALLTAVGFTIITVLIIIKCTG